MSHAPPVQLVPFRARHAAGLCLRPAASQVLAGLGPLPELARRYEAAGPAWTLLAGDWPLACGGVVRFWPGAGELWCWTGVEAAHWPVAFARRARRLVDGLLSGSGCTGRRFHRLQAHVREADAQGRAFAAFLGLGMEGRCPGYGPDRTTHLLYGRFQQWKA